MVPNSVLATWIHLTNVMDRYRSGLTSPEKMRYTRLRHTILHGGDGVTDDDVSWLRERIRATATH